MTKSVFWGLRVSEVLDERARAEAANRGQNLSEFVRYALTSFFDRHDDSRPRDGDRAPQEAS